MKKESAFIGGHSKNRSVRYKLAKESLGPTIVQELRPRAMVFILPTGGVSHGHNSYLGMVVLAYGDCTLHIRSPHIDIIPRVCARLLTKGYRIANSCLFFCKSAEAKQIKQMKRSTIETGGSTQTIFFHLTTCYSSLSSVQHSIQSEMTIQKDESPPISAEINFERCCCCCGCRCSYIRSDPILYTTEINMKSNKRKRKVWRLTDASHTTPKNTDSIPSTAALLLAAGNLLCSSRYLSRALEKMKRLTNKKDPCVRSVPQLQQPPGCLLMAYHNLL